MRLLLPAALMAASALACDSQVARLGPVRLHPTGFFESIAAFRSDGAEGISTRLGRIPLEDTPVQVQNSLRHSRLALCAASAVLGGSFTAYFESDFLDAGGSNRFRARQYYGEYQSGGWRVLGGQAWSLLRPNRRGIRSDGALLNTHAIEPAYHVGLAGLRKRQARIVRDFRQWHAALSYEEGGDVVAKVANDKRRLHWEGMALAGKQGRRALSVAGVFQAGPGFDIVAQQFWSKGAGPELLSILPARVNTLASIEGIEWRPTRSWQLFAYAGVAYGARSSGNRAATQWTAGFYRDLYTHETRGSASLGVQYSQLDRAVWGGPSGRMNYAMVSFRYSLPHSPSLFNNGPRIATEPGGGESGPRGDGPRHGSGQ